MIYLAHLGGKAVAVDGVLAAGVIHEPVVQVYLVELVAIAERPAGYVDGLPRVVVDGEDDAVAGVAQDPGDLVLVQVQRLEIRIEQEALGLEVDGRLAAALVAERPFRVD